MTTSTPENASPVQLNLRNSEAFQKLYAQRYLTVYRFIYGLHGGPSEDVEDLTAETFVRAWKARRRFRGTERA
ncbi:MAG TPA: hypothetical protein DEH25_03885, partial [Chloroflexi bacterium]|nr:hypothetical protein [Chloroflexota bacterium]